MAIANRQSFVVDGLGNTSVAKLQGKFEVARAAGYKIRGHYVTIPTENAVERAHGRALGPEKRFVPDPITIAGHRAVSSVFPDLAAGGLFDSLELVYNGDDRKAVIGKTNSAGKFEVLDQGLYTDFVNKGKD